MACYDFSADYCIIYRHCLCFSHFQDYAIFNCIATNACGENMLSGNWIIIASIVFFQCETPHTWTDNEFEPHTYTQLEMVGDNTNWIRKSLPPPPLRCVSINRSANFPVPGRHRPKDSHSRPNTIRGPTLSAEMKSSRTSFKHPHIQTESSTTDKVDARGRGRPQEPESEHGTCVKATTGRSLVEKCFIRRNKKKQKIARSEKEAGAGDA